MSVHEEDDFELVLGNRQLFFLAVVLFGVFFSIGYTVGYSRGRESADEVSAATRQPAPLAEPAPSLTPPDTLVPEKPLADREGAGADRAAIDPAAIDPAAINRSGAESTRPSSGGAVLAQSNPPTGRKPQPTGSTSTASAVRPPAAASTTPARSVATAPTSSAGVPGRGRDTATGSGAATQTAASAEPRQSSQATIAVPAIKPGAIYLQVLASREADPAREALLEIRAKGHPVTLDNIDPAWYRILVGPFDDEQSAAEYQIRLQQEKIDSFIRKL